MTCKNGNHIIGCGFDVGAVTMDTYVETNRKHPGKRFKFCPCCGDKLDFIGDLADKYKERLGVDEFNEAAKTFDDIND